MICAAEDAGSTPVAQGKGAYWQCWYEVYCEGEKELVPALQMCAMADGSWRDVVMCVCPK
jgi:hypothetical protein